jgi:SecD/SecF fusion protein
VQDSLSALLTDAKDSTVKGNNPLFDKIIAQGVGRFSGLFSKRHCYN